MSCRKMPVVLAMWFFGFLLSISPLYAGTIFQNFNNNSFNTKYFGLINNSGDPTKASVAVTNNRLELTVPASTIFSAAYLQPYGNYNLIGDYDIQVDFNLLSWPANNRVNPGIVTTSYEVTRVNSDFGQGTTDAYLVSFYGKNPQFNWVRTSDNSGKLRLTRTGNTVSGYYWSNNAWQPIASLTDQQYKDPIGFSVGGYVGNRIISDITQVAFDNLKVTNAVFPSGPPLNLLLED